MKEIQIQNTTVNLKDEEGKFENDKDVKVMIKFVTSKKEFFVTVPVTHKVDRSPNPSIFESDKINFKVRVIKDGRLSPSGKISQKMVVEMGQEQLLGEFEKAAMKIWEHIKDCV